MDSLKNGSLVNFSLKSNHDSDTEHRLPSKQKGNKFVGGYFTFTLCMVIVMRLFSDGDFSGIYTLGVAVQCLGFYLLLAKVDRHKSVAGISARTLEIYILVFAFRLCSTTMR